MTLRTLFLPGRAPAWRLNRRLAALLLLLLLAQAAAIAHVTAHAASGAGASCEICLIAGQASHAVPASLPALPSVAPVTGLVVAAAPAACERLRPSPYRSRAPPRSV